MTSYTSPVIVEIVLLNPIAGALATATYLGYYHGMKL